MGLIKLLGLVTVDRLASGDRLGLIKLVSLLGRNTASKSFNNSKQRVLTLA